jgi:UDP-glucose 6-dehydrogenase
MKIYTNNNYEILSVNGEPNVFKYVYEVNQTREDLFGNFCNACIQGYKYEPQYELLFNENGGNLRDDKTGELIFRLDKKGNKIPNGFACYPFVNYQTLIMIQKQYNDSQNQVLALNAKIDYLCMMTGADTEVSHE